jgi:hypothetical protein
MISDQPRQAAASRDEYSLTIADVGTRYESAGFPRTIRTLQRYCAKGHLDAVRQETPFGDQFLITPASVTRHIAQIAEFAAAVSRDEARPAATDLSAQSAVPSESTRPTTPDDRPRQAAADDRYLARLEGEVDFLRGQITTKDLQIRELTERSRETNVLIGGLQRLLAPLLGSPDPHPPAGNSNGEAHAA